MFIRYLELKYKQIHGWLLPWRHVERSKMIGPWNKRRCVGTWTSDPNFKFQMFSNDILSDIIVLVIKAVTEKTVRFFVERKLQVMGFQELCLLCYETLGVRHSEAARVTLTSTLIWGFFACCCVGNFQIWILSPKKYTERCATLPQSICSTFCVL